MLRLRILILILILVNICIGCKEKQKPPPEDAIRIFGKQGSTPGNFNKPRAIAVSQIGNIYVVDMTGRIQAFSSDGKFILYFRTPEIEDGKPTGLGFTKDGDLLVADTHYYRILVYTPKGDLIRKWGEKGPALHQFSFVTAVISAPDGSIYASQYGADLGEEDRIQKFDANGNFLIAWGKHGNRDGEFDRPMALAVDREGRLLVADACNHRIQMFSQNGKFIKKWGVYGKGLGEMSYPYGVASAPCGDIYVAEFGNNRIQKFSSEGKPIAIFGGPGRDKGEFANPWDIGIGLNGDILVVDALNHRIQAIPQKFISQ